MPGRSCRIMLVSYMFESPQSKLVNSTSMGLQKCFQLSNDRINERAKQNKSKVTRVAMEQLSLFAETQCQLCLLYRSKMGRHCYFFQMLQMEHAANVSKEKEVFQYQEHCQRIRRSTSSTSLSSCSSVAVRDID